MGGIRDPIAEARRRMLRAIDDEVEQTADWTGREALSAAVKSAMARVPRHVFAGYGADDPEAPATYANRARPIGLGQTISQPYIVAIMTELLDLRPTDRVLEIGTGCGYQAAVLAELAAQVYSVERIAELARVAERNLAQIGCANVTIRVGDGFEGWPEEAPFDAAIVTAAPTRVPDALKRQLADGGRMVIPVGPEGGPQMLHRLCRRRGEFIDTGVLPVAFVPMLRNVAT